MKEKIYDIYWEGPFSWENYSKHIESRHILYQITGQHHLYGSNVLLYIGSTAKDIVDRLSSHRTWVEDEYDGVSVRIGSAGLFESWDEWNIGKYRKLKQNTILKLEKLLICAHQPAYNSKNKEDAKDSKGIRIFNSGKIGQLLPEVSYLYHLGK